MGDKNIQLFEDQRIRTAWNEEREEWLFSVVDVCAVLTDQPTQRGASNYWAKLKERLNAEGANQLLTNCQQLKMTAEDGKQRLTDVANAEQLLRIVQSVPSPKAEPFNCGSRRSGGEVAGIARREAEKRTGEPVITAKNAADLSRLIVNVVEENNDTDNL